MASERLTSSLMGQLGNIAQNETAGDEGRRDEELRQAVTRAVLEGVIAGYGMAAETDSEAFEQNGGADSTKRRRLDQPDGQL